jgi:hypothetical protein
MKGSWTASTSLSRASKPSRRARSANLTSISRIVLMSLTRGFRLMPRSFGKVMNCFREVDAIVAPNVAPKISRIADGFRNAAGEPPSRRSASIMTPRQSMMPIPPSIAYA